MTFERKKCSLYIENNELYLYYNLNNTDYKIVLFLNEPPNKYNSTINLNKKKTLIPLAHFNFPDYFFIDECYCVNRITYPLVYLYSFINKNDTNSCTRHNLNLENKYFEGIFRYHNIDIFYELSKKYKNYNFDIHYNYNERFNNSYLSLFIN